MPNLLRRSWFIRIDLSALAHYGYSSTEIIYFEERMYKSGAKRMVGFGLN